MSMKRKSQGRRMARMNQSKHTRLQTTHFHRSRVEKAAEVDEFDDESQGEGDEGNADKPAEETKVDEE